MTETPSPDSLLRLLLLPLAKFCIRHGVGIQAAENSFRQALVEVSMEQMEASQLKVNVSRLCAMTGIYRHEIAKRLTQRLEERRPQLSIVSQVAAYWESNSRFRTKSGKPKVLTYLGKDSEFQRLVEQVSSHVGHAAVLVEMERKGIIEKTQHGLKLLKGGNVLKGDLWGAYKLVSRDIGTLISSAEANLTKEDSPGHIHVRTEYDNIYQSNLSEVQSWLVVEGKKFHKRVRSYLARFDSDMSSRKKTEPAGARVVVGTFSFSEKGEEELERE